MAGFLIPFQNSCHEDGDGAYTPPSGRDFSGAWSASNTIETARNHRYSLEILNPLHGDHRILQYAHKITRPISEFDVITIHNGQDEIYRPGKNRWGPIDITLYEVFAGWKSTAPRTPWSRGVRSEDNLTDQTAKLIYNWWGKVIDLRRSTLTRYFSSDRHLLHRHCEIAMLDGGNEIIWKYQLFNCWPIKITPSELSYQDTELASITLTVRFDKAIELDGDGSDTQQSDAPLRISGSTVLD